MEKLYSKNMKLVYQNNVGRLYDLSVNNLKTNRPIVFINGQFEHRIHYYELLTNLTKKSCYQQSNYWTYSAEHHNPYIWIYDYSIINCDKGIINTRLFKNSLLEGIKEQKLDNVDIMAFSNGGFIGAYASKNERIDKVVALHTPFTGTPLASISQMNKFYHLFTPIEKAFFHTAKLIVDQRYGFQIDNLNGLSEADLNDIDLNKLVLIMGSIEPELEKSIIIKTLYNIIFKMTGLTNDCVSTFDKGKLSAMGFYYEIDDLNHLELKNNFDYMEKTYQKHLIR